MSLFVLVDVYHHLKHTDHISLITALKFNLNKIFHNLDRFFCSHKQFKQLNATNCFSLLLIMMFKTFALINIHMIKMLSIFHSAQTVTKENFAFILHLLIILMKKITVQEAIFKIYIRNKLFTFFSFRELRYYYCYEISEKIGRNLIKRVHDEPIYEYD